MNPRRQLGGNTIIFGKQNKTLKSSLIDFSGQKAIFLLTIGQNLGKSRCFFLWVDLVGNAIIIGKQNITLESCY